MASKLIDIANTEAEAQAAPADAAAVAAGVELEVGAESAVCAASAVGAEPATCEAPTAPVASAAWYAVSVAPGTELASAEILRAALANALPAAECFAPLYRTQRKVAGAYVDEELPLIPGCICVVVGSAAVGNAASTAPADSAATTVPAGSAATTATPDNAAATEQAIRTAVRRTGVGTSARYAVEPLHEVIIDWLNACTTPGHRVVDASAGVANDGAVRVTAGPLAHKEQWIRKVNHRKKCAYLDIPAGAHSIQAQTGLKLARA